MRMRRWLPWIVIALALALPASVIWGADISGALYKIPFRVSSTTDKVNDAAPLAQGAMGLADSSFIETDGLNTAVQTADGSDVAAMPSSARMTLGACFSSTTVAITDQTAACANTTASDVALLDGAPLVQEASVWGFYTPGRILNVSVSQAGVGTWTVIWEYWNGSSWTAFSNVTDNTTGWTVAGTSTISWTMPTNWATSTISGYGNLYYARARTTAISSMTTQPLGRMASYETGQWWVYVENIDANESQNRVLYLGGADMQTYHPMFLGAQGVSTTDAVNLYPSTTSWLFQVQGFIDTSTTGRNQTILRQDGAFFVYVTSTNVIAAEIYTATSTIYLTATGVTPQYTSVGIARAITTVELLIGGSRGAGGNAFTNKTKNLLDSSQPLKWCENYSCRYMTLAYVLINGTDRLKYQPNALPTRLLTDRSGNGNTGLMSWPVQPTVYTVTADTMESARTGSGNINPVPQIVPDTGTERDLYGDATGSWLPGYDALKGSFDAAGIGIRLFWAAIGIVLVTMGLGIGWWATKNIWFSLATGGMVLVAMSFMGGGLLPMWVLFVYAPCAVVAGMIGRGIADN